MSHYGTIIVTCPPPPTPSAPVPLRADILPQQGQPVRTLDSQSRGAACGTQGALAAQGEPTWSARPGVFLSAERMPPLWAPGQEPQTCHAALCSTLWLGLCVYRRIKAGSQANSK
ncbi:unnamed protein product [Pipistrellus nathusii]|uniref:Uncharacterized protein n=1 Tax=Pipistrellus nathusii TaxID=59473 RepID=A0ABN9ZXV8_PIPNA